MNILNIYKTFIFSLVFFIYNYHVKKEKITKELEISTFEYIPISYQKILTISYLKKQNIRDLNSLILLNLLYISNICMLVKSVKLGYRIRYITDFLLLMIFIQETPRYKWKSEGNLYYHYNHDLYVYFFIVSVISEFFYFKYKYNKIIISTSLFFLFLINKNIPLNIILFNSKKYKTQLERKKKNFHKYLFFLQLFLLIGLNISRIEYDKNNISKKKQKYK